MIFPLVKLSEVVEINIGKTPSRSEEKYWGGNHPWLSIRDMSQGESLRTTKECITDDAVKESKIRLAQKGTVLFSFKLSIGKIGIAQRDLYHNEAIAAFLIKDKSKLYAPFLVQALKNINYLESTDRAVMGATLNKKKLAELKIPLPPLPVQKQIADVLEKANLLCKQAEQVESELNQLAQSLFLEMFGDPTSPSNTAPKIIFSKVLKNIDSGQSPKCESYPAENDNWGVLKLSAVTDCVFKPHENKQLPEGVTFNEKHEVKQGDLLFTRKNTHSLVAATAYVRQETAHCLLPDLIFRFVLKDEFEYLKPYLWGLFTNSKFRNLIQSLASGAAGSMPNISKAKLEKLELPIPPKEDAEKYASCLFNIWAQIDQVKKQKAEHRDLFNALLQKAFKGELTFSQVAETVC